MANANSTPVRKLATVSPRCKKGDLAILLSHGPHSGAIVDVVKYYSSIEMSNGKVLVNAWQIRHSSDTPGTQYFREDKDLLPIRPGDLDESETDERSLVKGVSA